VGLDIWVYGYIYNRLFNEETNSKNNPAYGGSAAIQRGRGGTCMPSLLLLRYSTLLEMWLKLYLHNRGRV
jgi:hypothetical protein